MALVQNVLAWLLASGVQRSAGKEVTRQHFASNPARETSLLPGGLISVWVPVGELIAEVDTRIAESGTRLLARASRGSVQRSLGKDAKARQVQKHLQPPNCERDGAA